MKRGLFILVAFVVGVMNAHALNSSQSRDEAYFLTDKMAYELYLSESQMEDIYEVNYDYYRAVGNLLRSYDRAYHNRLDALSYILSDWQWHKFMEIDYFVEPVRKYESRWKLLIYSHYHRDLFYFGRPYAYSHYSGGHKVNYYYDRKHIHMHNLYEWHHGHAAGLKRIDGKKYVAPKASHFEHKPAVQHKQHSNPRRSDNYKHKSNNKPAQQAKPAQKPAQQQAKPAQKPANQQAKPAQPAKKQNQAKKDDKAHGSRSSAAQSKANRSSRNNASSENSARRARR